MVSHAGKHATPHVCTWYTACSAAGLLSAASTYCSPVYICLPPCNTAAEVAAGQIGDHPQRERCCAKSQLPLVCRTQQFLPQDELPPQEQLPISQLCVRPTACCRSVLVTQAAHSHSPFLTPSVQVRAGGAGEGLGEGEGLGTGGAVHTRFVQMAVPWQSQLVAQAWPMRQAAPQPPPPLRTT